jgi:hypothetical protein
MSIFDEGVGTGFDFAGFIRGLQLDTGQPERADERERDARGAQLAEWRRVTAGGLPDWAWANWANEAWTRRLSPRVREALGSWKPFEFVGGGWRIGEARLVIGPSGCGKSSGVFASLSAASRAARLAAVASGKAFGSPPSLVWVSEESLVHEQAERKSELFRKAETAGLLVIDELGIGGGHVSQVGQSPVVAAILGRRYDAGRNTIATSGVSQRVLADRYGAGVIRRLGHGSVIADLFGSGVNTR